ncbi:MAG: hypothetical protein DWQ36_04610 [Acidobacteria bacterium]|nr:MAG: hypothetical protein DWQ30_16130 [Acidobacteriota bacterium]REK10320.1 MAG: hypothetical protein DWQ36_04610 [Acidobacteriota bacterium]
MSEPGDLGPRAASFEDEWVDDLMPSGFDWVAVVREHPMISLSVAALGGFLIGRWHGREIVDAASDLATAQISKSVDRLLEGV